jgi:hypothetical protein
LKVPQIKNSCLVVQEFQFFWLNLFSSFAGSSGNSYFFRDRSPPISFWFQLQFIPGIGYKNGRWSSKKLSSSLKERHIAFGIIVIT